MANHQGRSTQPKPETTHYPEVNWISLVRTDAGYQVARLSTRGNQIVSGPEPASPPMEKAEAEERFRVVVANDVFGWEEG